jgi:hypothetical protein
MRLNEMRSGIPVWFPNARGWLSETVIAHDKSESRLSADSQK